MAVNVHCFFFFLNLGYYALVLSTTLHFQYSLKNSSTVILLCANTLLPGFRSIPLYHRFRRNYILRNLLIKLNALLFHSTGPVLLPTPSSYYVAAGPVFLLLLQ